ncbi:PAAR domain-containing protein [Salmonella enterica subsp. enterica serovar Senftenberg]|nr:PAAR domain-containing protein [Salmonella enterica subsp. enterica serovar Senftenberg]
MYEAARVDDPIYHTSALAGFLIGAIIGIAIIALAAFAFFSCGFLAGLILGFMADQIASGVLQLGEAIGRSNHHTAGKILTGSENVSTNSRPAARAVLSTVKCDNHIAEKRIAQGSENIYINSQPAARKDDHTECDAVIEDGSPNVFLGGGTQTVLEISSEIPDWLRKVVDVLFVVASLLGGLAGAWRQAAKLGTKFGTKCAAKFIGGELVGMAVGEAISGLFSNPVDVTTGQKILLPETDFTLPGRLPVTCSRFYASHLETVGLLGRGWRLNWETSLREDDEHITLTGVQGRELRYPKTMLTPGHQIFDPEEQLYLSRLHDGRYVLHYTDRSYYVFGDFDSDGMAYLLFMETPHRQRIVFGHEGGRLVRIASSSGHHLLLHRTQTPAGERLSRIELVQGGTRGNLVEYRYDDNGQLTGVVNRAGTQVRQFAYENGLMTAHSNAAGFTCRYRWQELDGAPRVTEHDTSDGEHYRFDYDFAAGTTTVTGRQGESWQWWYDRETYITAHRTPGGGMYRFTYNEDHFPVNIELPGGRTVAYEYDIQNRVVKTTDPEGRVTQTQWNGEFDEITRTALDDDAVWKTQYNAHGQPVQETDPEGRVTQYAYDEQGQMCSRTDAAGGTVVTAFDSRGQMTRYTDCSGCSTGYDHDEDGNLTRVTDAEGKVVRISYNRLGLPETVNSPGKQQDRYTWNALGLMSSHRRITGSVESWRYTPRGLLAAHTDEEKRETRWQYTPEGRVAALTNGNGAQYRFSHDADGRLVREVRPDGLSRTFILDDSGYLTAIQTTGTQGGVRRETQQRDALGRLLRTENEHGQRTFSYNRLDQITAVTLTPTEAGQQQHRMQADTVRFEYDRSGWLTAEHAGNGSIRYQRDALGNPTDITLPDGQHLTHLYYGSGHLLQTALDGLTVSEYERDSLHRQIMRTQGQLTTYSGYDDDGLLSWQRSLASGSAPVLPGQRPARQGCVTSRDYYWNNRDQITSVLRLNADGQAQEERYRYTVNEQIAESRINGILSQHDYRNECVTQAGDSRYEYDACGRVIKRTEQKRGFRPQEWRYRWDDFDRLREVRTPDGEVWQYSYDAFGRRTAKRNIIRAAWKQNHHTVSEVRYQWLGMALSASEKRYADGSPALREQWHYRGGFELLAKEARAANDDTSDFYPILIGPDGAPQEMYSANGRKVWRRQRSLWGLAAANDASPDARESCDAGFMGQWQDEESGLWYNLHRYYNARTGQYLSPDPLRLAGGLNTYGYVHNPLTWADPYGLAGCSAQFKSRNEAFRAAKRDAGIPMNQQPDRIFNSKTGFFSDHRNVPMTDSRKNPIFDNNGNQVWTREYQFTRADGSKIIIQDHSAGHSYADGVGNQGSHLNVRPIENTRTGSVPGTFDHYEF